MAPLAAPPAATVEEVVAEAKRWRAAGATAFHVGVGAETFADYLRRIEWFGREVIARVEQQTGLSPQSAPG